MAECGYRLTVRDLPKGNYEIVNWVLFSKNLLAPFCRDLAALQEPAVICTPWGSFKNLLADSTAN